MTFYQDVYFFPNVRNLEKAKDSCYMDFLS